jgi:diguanylate cyclase (GGDEF)-like protein
LEGEYLTYLLAVKDSLTGNIPAAEKKLNALLNSTPHNFIEIKSTLLLLNLTAIRRDWEQSLLLIDKIKDKVAKEPKLTANAYLTFSLFFIQLGEYDLGQTYAKKALNHTDNENHICRARSLINEANFWITRGPLKDPEAIAYCSQVKEPLWANYNIGFQARYLFEAKKYQETIKTIASKLQETEQLGYPVLTSAYYHLLAESYFALGDYESAASFGKKVLSLNEFNVPFQSLVSAYKILYQIEAKKRNYEKAFNYLEQFHKYDKLDLNETKAKQIAVQTVNQRLYEKETQIELLNKKNEALTLASELAKKEAQNKTLWILLLAIVTTFFAYLAVRTKRTHVKLRQLAEFDSLTGIANRRHFTQQCEEILNYNCSINQAVSFILFDLDRFKAINDTYGHPVGDWVLQQVPKPVLKIIRKIDVFGRMGGEEFAILLPGCELEKARQIAEDIRKGLMAIEPKEIGHDFQITASFGLTISRVSGYDLDQLMIHSDEALYQAKRAGRNRVCVYSMTPSEQDDASEAEADQTDNN